MRSTYLKKILKHYVLEVEFIKKTNGENRPMLCTCSRKILNTPFALQKLGFVPPTNPPSYNPDDYNNVIVWDFNKLAFRTIACDTVRVKTAIEEDEFIQWLNRGGKGGLHRYVY